jgi:hypothetical protein
MGAFTLCDRLDADFKVQRSSASGAALRRARGRSLRRPDYIVHWVYGQCAGLDRVPYIKRTRELWPAYVLGLPLVLRANNGTDSVSTLQPVAAHHSPNALPVVKIRYTAITATTIESPTAYRDKCSVKCSVIPRPDGLSGVSRQEFAF